MQYLGSSMMRDPASESEITQIMKELDEKENPAIPVKLAVPRNITSRVV